MYKNTKHSRAMWDYKFHTQKEINGILLQTEEQCIELIRLSRNKLISSGLMNENDYPIPDFKNKNLHYMQLYLLNRRKKFIAQLNYIGMPNHLIENLPLYFLILPKLKPILANYFELNYKLNIPFELQAFTDHIKSKLKSRNFRNRIYQVAEINIFSKINISKK